jgi:arginine-tRNA-protein transferase
MRQGPALHGIRLAEDDLGAAPHFYYVLGESACPYLPGRRERKLITEIKGAGAAERYGLLSRSGFRRSHNYAYRPACAGCRACVPVRVRVREFRTSPSLRRIAKANDDLRADTGPAQATAEQFAVFRRYIVARHAEGEMAEMTFGDYRSMIEQTRIDTSVLEYRTRGGALVAASLVDWLADGPSAVYSFFEPDLARRSLGTYMILDLVSAARARALPHVYLGYWIENAPKMAYKARFRPLEGFRAGHWRTLVP